MDSSRDLCLKMSAPDETGPTWESYKKTVAPLSSFRPKTKPEFAGTPPKNKTLSLLSDAKRSPRALKNGEIRPQAKLDLHGKTQAEAHSALLRFVERSRIEKKRFLLVVTGKGKNEGSVLKTNVPRWCEVPPLSAYLEHVHPAALRHGGSGALYLILRVSR